MIGRPRADRPLAITLGGDKGFDAADFVMELREINVTPHIARNTTRRSAIDGRTTRHPGYVASQRIRKRIEEGFGWMKTIAGLRKTKYRGLRKVRWAFTFAAAACMSVASGYQSLWPHRMDLLTATFKHKKSSRSRRRRAIQPSQMPRKPPTGPQQPAESSRLPSLPPSLEAPVSRRWDAQLVRESIGIPSSRLGVRNDLAAKGCLQGRHRHDARRSEVNRIELDEIWERYGLASSPGSSMKGYFTVQYIFRAFSNA